MWGIVLFNIIKAQRFSMLTWKSDEDTWYYLLIANCFFKQNVIVPSFLESYLRAFSIKGAVVEDR